MFIHENIRSKADGKISRCDAYGYYQQWCERNGKKCFNQDAFHKQLLEHFPQRDGRFRCFSTLHPSEDRVRAYVDIEVSTTLDGYFPGDAIDEDDIPTSDQLIELLNST
jgi:phage/plasmid-associated DNA primase